MASSTPPVALGSGDRHRDLAAVDGERFDVVVIGGGITGAGVARDAAHRGLRVAVVEAEDWASGTSSRSSKLIHGGLRYLAMGDVGLVRETALERKAVRAMAPHLAEPCWMVVPARNRAELLRLRTGIGTYERLGAVDAADRHHNWGADELAQHEPHLRRDRFPHACAYREYLTEDSRLVLAVLRDAVAHGARTLHHAAVNGMVRTGDRLTGVIARCALTGNDVEIRARVIVNAAGPWVEQIAALEDPEPAQRLHLSKGVHVVVSTDRLPVRNLVVFAASDGRSIFALPRHNTVAVGTTDTSYSGTDTRWPQITSDDVAYLLEPLARDLDIEPLDHNDVIAAWSGLRPLVDQPGKKPKEMSRKDEIWIGAGGMVTVAGGKLTGFRAMAAQVVQRLGEHLDQTLEPTPPPTPVPGGDLDVDLGAAAATLAASARLDRPVADRLVRLYGSEAADVAARGSEPIVDGGLVVDGEIEWAMEVEAAVDLEDVIYRRTRAACHVPDERDALVDPVAAAMAQRLGWDSDQTDRQRATVREQFEAELTWAT